MRCKNVNSEAALRDYIQKQVAWLFRETDVVITTQLVDHGAWLRVFIETPQGWRHAVATSMADGIENPEAVANSFHGCLKVWLECKAESVTRGF